MAPPLADGFVTRPETAPSPAAALIPGALVALVSGRPAAEGSPQRGEPRGTTQLAVYMAESLWWSREVDLLAWVAGGSRASVLAGYLDAAAAAGIDPDGTAEEVAARFVGWLRRTARPWMVVVDGLRDAADLNGLWPSGPAGRVVITAPNEKIIAGQPGVQVMTVGPFSLREAMTYLMGRLSTDPDQRHGAMGLAAELDCQPLALAQASATIATSIVSCEDYQDRLTRRGARLTSPGSDRPPVGEVAWRLSAEQAERLSPGGAAWMVLVLAALLGGDAIPGTVFTAAAACEYLAAGGAPADAEHAWDTVPALARTGLLAIGADSEPAVVWMSPVVAAQVRAATTEEMSGQAVTAAADALMEAWPDDPPPWLATALRSCASSVYQAGGERLWAAGPHPLLLRAGQSMDSARLTGPALAYWNELATTSEKLLGPDNPTTLAIGGHLVQALLAAGRASSAVEWSQWVLAGQTRTLGPDHPGTLAARVSLGRALVAAGQPGHAVSALAQAATECGRVHGPGHLDTLSARDELAAACLVAGNPGDAIDHYRRTLADREHIQGPGHPDTITARDKLAAAYLADGRFPEAISCRAQALADRERVLGPDHLDTLAARADLASVYSTAGHIAAALQLFEQVCGEYERVLGANHPQTLASQADLARAYHAAGRLTDAAALFRDTLARCEQVLPPSDPVTQGIRDIIAGAAAGDKGMLRREGDL
jgi:tetratricopeptide (TPR) repeat protein